MRVRGRPVILVGEGEEAAAKQRLLERAGAVVVREDHGEARLAVVVDDDAAAERLRTRGVLVNATDRPGLCDWTLPAIVDRDPVLIGVGTGGVSAGLAAALRQRLEALLPASLGQLATDLQAAKAEVARRYPDGAERRRVLGAALAEGGALDPLRGGNVAAWLAKGNLAETRRVDINLRSDDPDDLTLREARWLALADRVYHDAAVPPVILSRARADAARHLLPAPAVLAPGLTAVVTG